MHRMRLTLVAGITMLAVAAPSVLVSAHDGATGVVKERMDLMSSIAKATKTATEMFQGTREYDSNELRDAARTISAHGGETMTSLFPKGSIKAPSEALPAIWQDWERFSALAGELSAYATALSEAAGNPRAGRMHGTEQNSPMGMNSGGGPMGRTNPMMGAAQSPMMGRGTSPMNDPEALAQMPPDAAFARLMQTCSACHTSFRKSE